MITQVEFLKRIGVSYKTLKSYQKDNLFLPVYKLPTGRVIYYDESEVDNFKRYVGLSAKEFAERIGISTSTLYAWNDSGRLKADHKDKSGHLRYSHAQIEKYYLGYYDGVTEQGFINRKKLAEMIEVSESTLILWCKKDLLVPNHKSITKVWQYSPEQVEHAKRLKERSSL